MTNSLWREHQSTESSEKLLVSSGLTGTVSFVLKVIESILTRCHIRLRIPPMVFRNQMELVGFWLPRSILRRRGRERKPIFVLLRNERPKLIILPIRSLPSGFPLSCEGCLLYCDECSPESTYSDWTLIVSDRFPIRFVRMFENNMHPLFIDCDASCFWILKKTNMTRQSFHLPSSSPYQKILEPAHLEPRRFPSFSSPAASFIIAGAGAVIADADTTFSVRQHTVCCNCTNRHKLISAAVGRHAVADSSSSSHSLSSANLINVLLTGNSRSLTPSPRLALSRNRPAIAWISDSSIASFVSISRNWHLHPVVSCAFPVLSVPMRMSKVHASTLLCVLFFRKPAHFFSSSLFMKTGDQRYTFRENCLLNFVLFQLSTSSICTIYYILFITKSQFP